MILNSYPTEERKSRRWTQVDVSRVKRLFFLVFHACRRLVSEFSMFSIFFMKAERENCLHARSNNVFQLFVKD